MSKLKAFGAILTMAVFIGLGTGCGSDLVKKLDGLADEACACKDKECAETVDKKIQGALESADKPSKDDTEKIMKSMAKAGECMRNLQFQAE